MTGRGTLHRRLVLFIFYVLLLSSFMTAAVFISVINFGLLTGLRLPPLTLPLISLCLSTLLGMIISILAGTPVGSTIVMVDAVAFVAFCLIGKVTGEE